MKWIIKLIEQHDPTEPDNLMVYGYIMVGMIVTAEFAAKLIAALM